MSDIPTDTGTSEGNQIVKDTKVFVRRSDWGLDFALLFVARNPIDNKPLCSKLIYEPYPEPFGMSPNETVRLLPNEIQSLMNELWNAGVRPSEEIGYDSRIKATERHLEDMRRIAFKFLDRDGND